MDSAPSTRLRHCVVIGAGVLGASVAARLAGSGVRVTLLDRDEPGRATSRWSFAWLNSNNKSPRPYHDLNHAGIRAWADLAPDLDGAAWYRPVGHLELVTSAAAQAELTARVRRLSSWNYDAHLIDPAEAVKLEPALRLFEQDIRAAAWFPGEGYVLTEPLIARLVARLTADDVICCAGRWTPALAALAVHPNAPKAPDLIPLVPWDTPGATAPGLVVQVGPVTRLAPTRIVHAPDISLRPHSGGLLHLEAPDVAVDLHTPDAVLRRWAGELLGRAQRTVLGLDQARVTGYQVCVRPMPVDHQSIVGRIPADPSTPSDPSDPGLYVAVTHSAVTLAAHLANLITADLSPGNSDNPSLTRYRPTRFRVDDQH